MSTLKQTIINIVDNLELFPAIWDIHDHDYSNRIEKQKQLEKLSSLCGCTAQEVEKKYSSLRTRFRKEWNLVESSKKSGAGTTDVYTPSWSYYQDLMFLIPSLVVREGTDSLASPEASTSRASATSSDIVEVVDSESCSFPAKKRRKLTSDSKSRQTQMMDSLQLANGVLKDYAENKSTKNMLPPDIQGFMMTLGTDLASIADIRVRKLLMVEFHNRVVEKMFPEKTDTDIDTTRRPSSAPVPSASTWPDHSYC